MTANRVLMGHKANHSVLFAGCILQVKTWCIYREQKAAGAGSQPGNSRPLGLAPGASTNERKPRNRHLATSSSLLNFVFRQHWISQIIISVCSSDRRPTTWIERSQTVLLQGIVPGDWCNPRLVRVQTHPQSWSTDTSQSKFFRQSCLEADDHHGIGRLSHRCQRSQPITLHLLLEPAAMTTLLDLPNEIKLEIIETIAPDDIENFSLCCKSVYDLAGRTLRQHMVDKTTYRRCFSLSTWNEGHTMCLVAYCKLRDMSESRRLRLYPRSIRIGNYTVSDQDRETNRLRHPEYVWSRSTQVMDKVRGISDSIFNNLDSPCVDMDEMKAWRKKIGDGEVGAANCLLLTLLPNVERIDVDELDRSHSEMSDMIYKISKTNEDVSSMIWEKLSLVKLQEVHVHSLACLGGATTQSRVLEACMTLPSLRIVRGTQLGRRYKFNEWIYPDRCSNVTELHFRGCTLAVKHLACLFKHLKSLQIFSYDHFRLPETPGKEYGPDELIDALCLYAKTTLTFFNYTSDAGTTSETIGCPMLAPYAASKPWRHCAWVGWCWSWKELFENWWMNSHLRSRS